MHQQTLCDIHTYLNFLEQSGFSILLRGLDPAFEPCTHSSPYFKTACFSPADDDFLPVRCNKKVIAFVRVHCTDPSLQPQCDAVCAPLPYLLERLYDQCSALLHLPPIMEAYHKALALIKANYMQEISVNYLAKDLGYSVSYFGYFFKKMQGVSVSRYLMDFRLEKATELLRSSLLSIADIAEKVGLGDANYFSTAFKAKYGVSPRKYRSQTTQNASD